MISLGKSGAPRRIDLPSGVTVTVAPPTTAVYRAAEYAAGQRARRDATASRLRAEADAGGAPLPPEYAGAGLPDGLDPGNPAHVLGLGIAYLAEELAAVTVTAWEGIEDDLTPDTARQLMREFPEDAGALYAALDQRRSVEVARREGKPSPASSDG